MKESKNKILSDHKMVGKKLIPPFLHSFNFSELPYVHNILPEIIWQGFLLNKFGIKHSVELTLFLQNTIQDFAKTEKGKLFCFISNFETLSDSQVENIISGLSTIGYYKKIIEALTPFLNVFPECPLNKIFKINSTKFSKEELDYVKTITNQLINKKSKETTLILANTVYCANQIGVLHVTKDSCFLHMDEIINYPNTEESKKIASFLRASINPFVGNGTFVFQNSHWLKYFWNRAYKLEPFNIDNLYFS